MEFRNYPPWITAALAILSAIMWFSPPKTHAQDQMPSMSMGAKGDQSMPHMMSPELMMPSMDPAKGRILFASKGCVVCHSVNGIGGTDAAALDAKTMPGMTNPFDFVANMWRGAEPMIKMQEEELGGQVEFTGQELSDIIAFLHHEDEQKKFSESDIPPKIKAVMAKADSEDSSGQGKNMGGMSNMKMKPEKGKSN
jgi:cytochrome c